MNTTKRRDSIFEIDECGVAKLLGREKVIVGEFQNCFSTCLDIDAMTTSYPAVLLSAYTECIGASQAL